MITDTTIHHLSRTESLISPYNEFQVQPHSYDCLLGPELLVPGSEPNTWVKSEDFVIPPQGFALAHTQEYFKIIPTLIGFVCGKSTIGRSGLQIENAGLIDSGFQGQITLELYNMSPWLLKLEPGMRICQIYFIAADSPATDYFRKGNYVGQKGATPPRLLLGLNTKPTKL